MFKREWLTDEVLFSFSKISFFLILDKIALQTDETILCSIKGSV